MERASRVMYTIANVFNWVLAALYAILIVCAILGMTGAVEDMPADVAKAGSLAYFIVGLIVALVTICLVRIAKDKHSSKGWDILFIVLGAINGNVFYILGGIFGLVAVRK